MPTPRVLTAHRLRSGSVMRSVVGAAFLAVAGLSFLYLKNQLYVSGARKRGLETEQRDLTLRGRVLDAQIAELTSRTALQSRLKDGFIHMAEIPTGSVVHVRLLPEASTDVGLALTGNNEVAVAEVANRGLRPSSEDGNRTGFRTARQ